MFCDTLLIFQELYQVQNNRLFKRWRGTFSKLSFPLNRPLSEFEIIESIWNIRSSRENHVLISFVLSSKHLGETEATLKSFDASDWNFSIYIFFSQVIYTVSIFSETKYERNCYLFIYLFIHSCIGWAKSFFPLFFVFLTSKYKKKVILLILN